MGDSLGRILTKRGAEVTREYYFNDHGTQIDRFARSLVAAAKGQPTPEDGYGGDYIQDIANQITSAHEGWENKSEEDLHEFFRAEGVELMFAHIKRTLAEFGTEFDVYFHENSLFESGAVDKAIQTLKSNGNLYESEGAWWLRASNFGDDRAVWLLNPMAMLLISPAISLISRTRSTAATTYASTCWAPITMAISPV